MWLQEPRCRRRNQTIAAGAMMWLQEPRLVCTVVVIYIFLNSRPFEANFLGFCLLLGVKKKFLTPAHNLPTHIGSKPTSHNVAQNLPLHYLTHTLNLANNLPLHNLDHKLSLSTTWLAKHLPQLGSQHTSPQLG